jgi:flavin-dependent dehydrogenase
LNETADVVVIGGGPAGSSAAGFLAKHNRRVILLEREKFPRHHVGESTLQGLFGMLDEEIGVGEKLKQVGFRVKTGGSFVWGKDRTPWSFHFTDSADRNRIDRVGFEVERELFDQVLLDHCHSLGVDVREEANVNSLIVVDDRVQGVTYRNASDTCKSIEARYVIDASGLGSIASRQLGIDRKYDKVRNFAIYGYWDSEVLPYTELGGDITEGDLSNILIVHSTGYWIWFIPLRGRISVGVVAEINQKAEVTRLGVQDFYLSKIFSCPEAAQLLKESTLIKGEPLRTLQDWSHICERICGPGYFLVGDAAAFVDPILSSGVHLAVTFGLNCGRSVNTLLTYPEEMVPWVYSWYSAAYGISYEDFRQMADAWYLGSGRSEDWFEVAQQRVQETLNEELSRSEAFARLASGTLTSGSFRDRVCYVDTDRMPPRVYFSPVTNRYSYTVEGRETLARFLDGFPTTMIAPVFDVSPSASANFLLDDMPIRAESVLSSTPEVRIGFFSERGHPVLEAGAYLTTPNQTIDIGMYAPLHPVLVRVLECLDGQHSVEEIAAKFSMEPRGLVQYLNSLASAGFIYLLNERSRHHVEPI